jgi:hypothetical protein
MSSKAFTLLWFSIDVVIDILLLEGLVDAHPCEDTVLITFPFRLNEALNPLVIVLCHMDMRIFHHHSSYVSHLLNSGSR